jgi:hypothetical protein
MIPAAKLPCYCSHIGVGAEEEQSSLIRDSKGTAQAGKKTSGSDRRRGAYRQTPISRHIKKVPDLSIGDL